jgi:hypothetical protein
MVLNRHVGIERLMPQGAPEARLEGWSRLNAIAPRPFVARWSALRGRFAAPQGEVPDLVSRCFT